MLLMEIKIDGRKTKSHAGKATSLYGLRATHIDNHKSSLHHDDLS